MPIDNLSDLSVWSQPLPGDIAGAMRQLSVWPGAVLLVSAMALAIAYVRRSLRQRAHADEDLMWQMAEVVSPDALRAGMTLTVDLMTPEGVRTGRGAVHAISRRSLALAVEPGVLPVRMGTAAHVTVASATAAFSFQTTVLECGDVDDVPLVSMRRPAWMERMQRRQYFRIDVDMPTSAVWNVGAGASSPTVRASIVDISGGGMAVALPSRPHTGMVLRVRLPIAEMGEPTVDVRVLRVQPCDAVGFECVAHCEMLYVNEETRNLLVTFCFGVQRDLIRRRDKDAADHRPRKDG